MMGGRALRAGCVPLRTFGRGEEFPAVGAFEGGGGTGFFGFVAVLIFACCSGGAGGTDGFGLGLELGEGLVGVFVEPIDGILDWTGC